MRRVHALLASALASAAFSASLSCGGNPDEDTVTRASSEEELTVLDLSCRNGANEAPATFMVEPAYSGVGLEGRLLEGDVTTSFVCTPASKVTDVRRSGIQHLVVACTERPAEELHRDRWQVDVTKVDGQWQAQVNRFAVLPDVALACTQTLLTERTLPATYAEVAPLVEGKCGTCHEGVFDSIPKIRAKRDLMIGLLSTGEMPRRDPEWRYTEDGQVVLDFLKRSPELR